MKKATIQTISAASGFSTATVDRVLNNRANVNATTKHKVLETARDLGYLSEVQNVPMPARPARLEFLMPVGTNTFLYEMSEHIEDFCQRLPLVASVKVHRLGGLDPEEFYEAAAQISPKANGVGVVATDHPSTRELLKDIANSGTRVVTIASDVPSVPRAAYVGVDNLSAGRLAGLLVGRLLHQRPARVGIILGSHLYRGHEERITGFRSILENDFRGIEVKTFGEAHDARQESYRLTERILESDPNIAGIYCVGGGRLGIAKALREHQSGRDVIFVCHEHTAGLREFLLDGTLDAIIDQNARLLAEQSVIALLGSIAATLPNLARKFIEPRVIFKENIPNTALIPSPM